LFVLWGAVLCCFDHGPLLQRWFAETGHRDAAIRIFFTPSAIWELHALLAYPALVEPWLRLNEQAWLWTFGYGALLILIAACVVTLRRARPDSNDQTPSWAFANTRIAHSAFPTRRFAPGGLSSMSRPASCWRDQFHHHRLGGDSLLWVLPLAIYLLTIFWRLRAIADFAANSFDLDAAFFRG